MSTKNNLIENWDKQYEGLGPTYTEKINTVIDFGQVCSYEDVREDIVEYLPDYKSAKIIEVGCGGARNSVYLALRGFNITCSDNSLGGLRMAQINFQHTNATGTFLLDDLMNSKIPAESFDCVMSFGLLEHFKDLKPLVANLTRLVRPGGIQIHLIVPKKFSTQIINNVVWFPYNFLRLAIKKRDFKDMIRKSYRDFPHYENSFSASDYSRAFVEGGNEIIKVEPGDALTPLIRVPLGFGNILVKLFTKPLKKLMKLTHRTQSRFIYFLSPTFTVICRKNEL